MNIVSITHINVYTVCTKKHKWVTVRFVFLKALWLLYGDKIGRKQVWKWEIIGRVQTSQDVGGDRGDGGEERSRRQEETVSPPPPPGWNMVLPPQGRWTVLGLQSGLAPEWRLRCQEGTHILRGAHLCADMFPDPCPCTYVSPAGSQPRLLHAHRHSDPHSCTRRLTFIESQAPRTLQAVHHRAFAAWRMRFESCFPYRLVV